MSFLIELAFVVFRLVLDRKRVYEKLVIEFSSLDQKRNGSRCRMLKEEEMFECRREHEKEIARIIEPSFSIDPKRIISLRNKA